jgi:hypothetical protein
VLSIGHTVEIGAPALGLNRATRNCVRQHHLWVKHE